MGALWGEEKDRAHCSTLKTGRGEGGALIRLIGMLKPSQVIFAAIKFLNLNVLLGVKVTTGI